MFDDVVLPEPVPCPSCAAPLTRFQSKDGPCELGTLGPQDVNTFYCICPKCSAWVEFTRKMPRPQENWQDDFTVTFTPDWRSATTASGPVSGDASRG
jgi:hypothetical protein